MPRDYASLPFNAVRRKDRAVADEAWMEAFLERAPTGTLATVHNGQPFIHSNLFVYEAGSRAIYMHTARTGRTRANVETSGRACFHVSEMGRLLPAPTAQEFSVEYAGVTLFGTARIVQDEVEAERAMQRLLDKYFPHLRPVTHYQPITPEELALTTVYRIDIEQWSGKRKEVEEDYQGAFRYGEPARRPSNAS